jgi:GT2 family glycosyltransferase
VSTASPCLPRVSIVVVHFNTEALTRACLKSIHEGVQVPHEVFLVDNGSTDGSGERISEDQPGLRFLRLEEGAGFGAANNLAAREATGEFLLFLNSDTEVQNDAVGRMLSFMDEHPACVLAGCRLLKADGSIDRACRRSFPTPTVSLYKFLGLNTLFPKSPRFAAYDLRWRPDEGVYEVDSLVGAFLLARRSALPAGPFDEDFFFYGEDIDLCYRVKLAGGKVWYVGDVTMLHRKGGTTNQRAPWVIYHFHYSMRVFFDKHYRRDTSFAVTALVKTGVWLRMFIMLFLNIFRRRAPE